MTTRNRAAKATGATASLLFALTMGMTPVLAQDAQPPATPAQDATTAPQNGTLAEALSNLTKQGDVVILADRSVASQALGSVSGEIRSENVEQALAQLIKALPTGTVWAKVYLPSDGAKTGTTPRWNADTVTDYVLIQSELFGSNPTAGASTDGTASAGTVEIMGKRLSGREANNVTSALKLKPVYVIYNPMQRANRNGPSTQPATDATSAPANTPPVADPNTPPTQP